VAFTRGQAVQSVSNAASSRGYPSTPRVEEGGDLAETHRREDAVLNHYGWVDKNAGKVHIPIDRAIDLLSERGLPARPQTSPKPEAAQ
jgi:hypothetical protein